MSKYKLTSRLATEKHVYRAIDTRTNEDVVLKLEHKDDALNLLKHEALIYMMLKDVDGVLNLKWFGNFNNSFKFIALPFVETTLEDVITLLPTTALDKLAMDMINILKNVHSKHILHRDVKPSNFLIDNNGKLFLIDFGFSKKFVGSDGLHISERKTSSPIGTESYASIRSSNCFEPSRRDDMESVGYILYHCYTRKLLTDKIRFLESETIQDLFLQRIQKYLLQCYNLNFFQKPKYEF
jgi:serine/threonine protein kinase